MKKYEAFNLVLTYTDENPCVPLTPLLREGNAYRLTNQLGINMLQMLGVLKSKSFEEFCELASKHTGIPAEELVVRVAHREVVGHILVAKYLHRRLMGESDLRIGAAMALEGDLCI